MVRDICREVLSTKEFLDYVLRLVQIKKSFAEAIKYAEAILYPKSGKLKRCICRGGREVVIPEVKGREYDVNACIEECGEGNVQSIELAVCGSVVEAYRDIEHELVHGLTKVDEVTLCRRTSDGRVKKVKFRDIDLESLYNLLEEFHSKLSRIVKWRYSDLVAKVDGREVMYPPEEVIEEIEREMVEAAREVYNLQVEVEYE